jgi:hypothetical protein
VEAAEQRCSESAIVNHLRLPTLNFKEIEIKFLSEDLRKIEWQEV